MNAQPLENVEVVELCSAISGPFACRLLGDYGAHVTKVEPPGGETYRNLPPYFDSHDEADFTYRFLPYNTSKDSIAVDLKTDDGRRIVSDLVDEADVLVENMRPGVLEKLGLSWDAMCESNPELVYCDITGYGADGPYADWPAMDTTVQAVAGWADQIGVGDGPETMNVFMLDQLTAVYAAFAICMALVDRGTGNGGTKVDISMFDVALSFLNHHFAEHSAARSVGREADHRGALAPNDVIEVADGYLALYVADEGWDAFCEAIGRPEFADESHPFGTPAGRLERREELRERLGREMETKTRDEWASFINETVDRAICAPVTRVADLLDDPQVRHNDAIRDAAHPAMGPYALPRAPLRLPGGDERMDPAPALGEQTDEILQALGYPADEIEAFRERGVVR